MEGKEFRITKEYLSILQKRVTDIFFIKTGFRQPDYIELYDESLICNFSSYSSGCCESENIQEKISIEDLNSDNIDDLVKKKEVEVEEKRLENERRKQKLKELQEKDEKEKRYRDYLKLKEEFENGNS